MKGIPISSLSDDNFYEEECEDLRERIKARYLKRPTVLELETKAHVLHKDITKHVTVASDAAFEVHLRLSNLMKDIPISSLSDDNFYEEECEDLRERIKSGYLKRPTVVR